MAPSLRALLTNVVDYAGLFPPAKLPLDEAIRNYAYYRNESDSWMLGRFICPAARLNELSPYVEELFRDGLQVSALGRGADEATFLDGLKHDLSDIEAFRARFPGRVTVDVLETKSPTPAAVAAAQPLLKKVRVFYEQPGALAAFAEIDRSAGHKVRCGGVEAAAFPPVEQLSRVIAEARAWGVPLKFTAGLHHPVRRFDAGMNTRMHGFLNVFGAGVLAAVHDLDGTAVRDILEDEDARSFAFDADEFGWRGLRANVGQIEAARRTAVTSFGSCSFDEPRDDLRALNLL